MSLLSYPGLVQWWFSVWVFTFILLIPLFAICHYDISLKFPSLCWKNVKFCLFWCLWTFILLLSNKWGTQSIHFQGAETLDSLALAFRMCHKRFQKVFRPCFLIVGIESSWVFFKTWTAFFVISFYIGILMCEFLFCCF